MVQRQPMQQIAEERSCEQPDDQWDLRFRAFLAKLYRRWEPRCCHSPCDPLWTATDGQFTLPGSPDWSPDINPGCQPDGAVSKSVRPVSGICCSYLRPSGAGSNRGWSRCCSLCPGAGIGTIRHNYSSWSKVVDDNIRSPAAGRGRVVSGGQAKLLESRNWRAPDTL